LSKYSEQLGRLKKEISIIQSKKKVKFKKHQKDMINSIHRIITNVEFTVRGKTILLEMGDEKKGFRHILERHYNPNDLETMDILNLPIIFKNALELNEIGITNNQLTVYKMEKNQKDLRLVTNEIKDDKLVVTSYRKS